MKTLNKIIATAMLMFVFLPAMAQNDSIKSYSGIEFDLTAYKTKKKIVASTKDTVTYYDNLEYSGISSVLLLKDAVRFYDYGEEVKINFTELDKISFETKSYSLIGVLIGIPLGMIAGGLLGYAIDPPSGWFDSSDGAIIGVLLGGITGGLVGGYNAPSGYDNYYLKGKNNDVKRIEMMNILDSAKVKYKNDL